MTYLDLTKPKDFTYQGFKAGKVNPINIVNEEFVPGNLHEEWIKFKDFLNAAQENVQNQITPEKVKEEHYQPVSVTPKKEEHYQSSKTTPTTFAQLLKEEGVDARITSSYREGAVTSNGSRSHHGNKENPAIDIVPTNGKSYDELIIQMITNPKIMKYFKDHGWGIHSEVSKDQWNSLTTGAHLHIGPDNVAKKGLAKILEKYESGVTTDLWKYRLA